MTDDKCPPYWWGIVAAYWISHFRDLIATYVIARIVHVATQCWSTFWKPNLKCYWIWKFDIMEKYFSVVFHCMCIDVSTYIVMFQNMKIYIFIYLILRAQIVLIIFIFTAKWSGPLLMHREQSNSNNCIAVNRMTIVIWKKIRKYSIYKTVFFITKKRE